MARELGGVLRGEVCIDRLTVAMFSTDASIYQIEPLGVVFPACEEDIAQTTAYAAAERVRVSAPRRGG